MTNRIIKKSHFAKSKILLIILCILGLVFSYSCNCRNNSTAPDDNTTQTNKIITPKANFSTDLMVLGSDGKTTTQKLTITVDNADLKSYSVSGIDGVELQDDGNGNLIIKSGFDNITVNKAPLTITLNYEKKPDAEADTTLSKTTETKTIQVVKATKLSGTDIGNMLKKMSNIMPVVEYTFPLDNTATVEDSKISLKNNSSKTVDGVAALNPASFISELSDCIKAEKVKSTGYYSSFEINQTPVITGTTAVFTIIFKFNPEYEYNEDGIYKVSADAQSSDTKKGSWQQ